ncbi:hypothetical protein BG261_02810 [Floricoccus tropicus]|uniref:Phage protein n=1 Tax=Floricoccus tropicus TaxID=1859473 RepID=A0A1E8GMY9_9LACT|nr:hypothetical protein [Floricoccus tropicus]OFI49527.1 hypothetical protein BG261_02810 [Floricoccus tropicus]
MANKLKGITVILLDKKNVGKDPFKHPIYEDVEIEVDNVLVSPTSADDIINQLSIDGRKAVYTLAIPKGDTNDWENKEVVFFDKKWRTFGIPLKGIDELIPLDWNEKVMVERIE